MCLWPYSLGTSAPILTVTGFLYESWCVFSFGLIILKEAFEQRLTMGYYK